MSDARDAVREAMTRNKQLAARHLVRRQELEAEVGKLRRERDEVAGVADPDLLAQLDARIADRTTQLQAATYDYQQAIAELGELDRLGTKALGADARAIVASIHGDPMIRSAEQIALDNVREHAADLDAHDKLAAELGERPPVAAPAPSREDADAAAREAFAALRAKPQAPDDDPPAAPPRKKTL